MPDGRLAQFIVPAKHIDENPALVCGMMGNMIVMEARQIHDGPNAGIHYIVWHPRLPHLPPMSKETVENPRERFPWMLVDVKPSQEKPGEIDYVWSINGMAVITGAFKLVQLTVVGNANSANGAGNGKSN